MRLVSWNIHGGVGTDRRRDLSRIAALLEDMRCDAAALQEVGDPHRESRVSEVADDASWLGRRLGWFVAYGPNLMLAGRPYGNAVLSRFPSRTRKTTTSRCRAGNRAAACALTSRCRTVAACTCSISTSASRAASGAGRRRCCSPPICSATPRSPRPWWSAEISTCGRLCPAPSCACSGPRCATSAQVVGARRSTWPSALPLLRLDRAYVDDGVEVLASGVINDPRTRAASDHLPLWVELLPRPAEALAVGRAGA